MMRKVIITGANGFVGRAICKELIESGSEVIALVHRNSADLMNYIKNPNLRVYTVEQSDYKNIDKLIQDYDIDVFYHMSWEGSAGIKRGDYKIQLKNVQYTCEAVKACKVMGCKRFVFAGSIMEYEISKEMEATNVPGINSLYSSAKIAADYMARILCGSLGIEYIRTIISNIYGPGEVSDRLINTSIRKMLKGERCSFSSGEQTYDFIYITDAAKAFVLIGEKGKNNKTYYIGSRNPRPLKEFLMSMRDTISPDLEIGLGDILFTGISLTYKEFDIDAVKNDTGFVPQISYEEGIKNTADYLRKVM